MKSIIWKIELAAAVLLAVSALVWGLRPGVWNYGGFYRMAAGEQSRTYTRPGLTDNALYSMALGNHQTRIAGRPGEFLTAGLFLLLGLVLPLLLKPAIALDKFLLGFFYDNSEKLQATDLARGIMLLLGLVVSVIGAIWWCILLFG